MTNLKNRAIAGISMFGVAAVLLAGCAAGPDSGKSTTTTDTPKVDYTACMVSDAGGFDDNSFNQSSYAGLLNAKKNLGVTTKQAESADETVFASNINSLVGEGCNMIINVGFLLADATKVAAEANPDINFVLVDGTMHDEKFQPVTLPNVKSILYDTAQAAFLAGYLAAGTSETGTVATYGGMNIPTVSIFMDGFVDGVAHYNKVKGTSVKVLGWDKATQDGNFVGNFDDRVAGQTLTEGFINQGADIIFPVAGPVGHGTNSAALDRENVKVIWVDSDGYLTTEKENNRLYLTSVLKQMTEAVEQVIKEGMDGKFTNESYVGTLENLGVALAPFHDLESAVSDEMKAELEKLKADIISGALKVESPAQAIL